MLWHQVGIHFDIGKFVGMSLEVDFQVTFGGKSISTYVALVGPFPSMGPDVDLQS